MFDFVGGGVHLANQDLAVLLVVLADLVPDWGELFAMAAPRGICNKQITNQETKFLPPIKTKMPKS